MREVHKGQQYRLWRSSGGYVLEDVRLRRRANVPEKVVRRTLVVLPDGTPDREGLLFPTEHIDWLLSGLNDYLAPDVPECVSAEIFVGSEA